MAELKKNETKRFSYSEYCTWPEEESWELIDGEPFDMTPAPGTAHQEVFRMLFRQLDAYFIDNPCKLFSAPYEFRLGKENAPDDRIFDLVQPDIAVICNPNGFDERGGIAPPEFVIEILSPSTASKDHILKKALYERYGVKGYWLVDPLNRLVTTYLLESKGRYSSGEIHDSEAKIPVPFFPGLIVDFVKVFPEIPRIVRESPRKYKI